MAHPDESLASLVLAQVAEVFAVLLWSTLVTLRQSHVNLSRLSRGSASTLVAQSEALSLSVLRERRHNKKAIKACAARARISSHDVPHWQSFAKLRNASQRQPSIALEPLWTHCLPSPKHPFVAPVTRRVNSKQIQIVWQVGPARTLRKQRRPAKLQ